MTPPNPRPPADPQPDLSRLDPVPVLLRRLAGELSAELNPALPLRLSRAPGRLDVMGGIADYTGSLVCEMPLDRAAAVALQERADRQLRIFSFNLLDEHQPFTFGMPLEALADHSAQTLRREFAQPGRRWAGYIAGCLFILHEQKLIDLRDPAVRGLNLALYSTVPLGAGISSSAAIEVATMMNLRDHFGLASALDPLKLAAMCQSVENRIVGAPCGIMDQVASCAGRPGTLMRLQCQPHTLLPELPLPQGIRVIGINSNVKHSVGGGQYGKTRCAAFMAHSIILSKMRQIGHAAGKQLTEDPLRGYLANLPLDDYKRYFRQYLPKQMKGIDFLNQYGPTIDAATAVHPDHEYTVQQAADHHVFEAHRVRNFVQFLEQANQLPPDSPDRFILFDKAGHLMYASHLSYTNDALLGADECDLLVELVRKHEPKGLYGAKITGGGSGGTVAILADISSKSDEALNQIMAEYKDRTGRTPEAFLHSSSGAWQVGTILSKST
ncbi:MAG: hypothetical protein IT446_04235 [Phycisphaerales bacterium]|nr:hypothetical protein [Phycisphaerales bacterium]